MGDHILQVATLPGHSNEKHVGIMGEQSVTEDDDDEDDDADWWRDFML